MQTFSPFRLLAVTASVFLVILSFSCAATPPHIPGPEEERGVPEDVPKPPLPPEELPPPEFPPAALPPEIPVPEALPENVRIMGEGLTDRAVLSAFLLSNNPGVDTSFAEELSALYREEAAAEGINHDVAFAQMCLETGFLRYGGLVTPEMNNFCGLGAINTDSPGESFSNPRIGVRAHIQHLKAYASTDGLNQELVDPRYFWVRYGTAPTVDDLTGVWAADREYGIKLRKILGRLYFFNKAKRS
jgi:hypothetical protein